MKCIPFVINFRLDKMDHNLIICKAIPIQMNRTPSAINGVTCYVVLNKSSLNGLIIAN